jgi:hypothetical protein
MRRLFIYRHADPIGARPVAVIQPDGTVDESESPTIAGDIRAALVAETMPIITPLGDLAGPASRYRAHSPEWLMVAWVALGERGYRIRTEGYR